MKKINVNYEKMYYGFPIILISFYDKNGVPNVTTLSSSYTLKDMVVLGFSSKGYAINQIKEVRDFVINIPDSSLKKEASFCGTKSGHEIQKFDAVNLTPVKSSIINAPIIEECPISIECTLTDIIEKDAYKGVTNILGTIKGRLISNEYLNADDTLNLSKFDNLLYFGDGVNKGYRYMKNEL
ncbi:flavin reductase family protein [Clostridium saccharobutylicum]|uniref:Flavoredoxin n=1 Tax=Clostridium saccharobutylicum TaxID=169679 RepID=A0A1S8N2F4_CLOSA|nr:flavin reductase family protein [Clostridium saccharobutylicum]OOM10590.1 flavoredoxin [Clostridium saccharobutylicum]